MEEEEIVAMDEAMTYAAINYNPKHKKGFAMFNARNVNDRRDRRQNNRNDRLPRTETTPVQENIPAFSSPEQPSQVQNQPRQPQIQPQVEARRPLTPRIQAEVPVAPVVSAPIAAPVSAETAVNDFDPSKVRYGRRNVVKKLPELADED